MKNVIKFKKLAIICLLSLYTGLCLSQNTQADSLIGFNTKEAIYHASFVKTEQEKDKFLKIAQRSFIDQKYSLNKNKSGPSELSLNSNLQGNNCANMDFENSTTNGWQIAGDYQITSGLAVDPFGGFPIVYPGGKHSLKLNNNNISNKSNFSSSASRVISVGKDNNFLNLHFALAVLNFPHTESAAAKFKIQILNSANEVLECPKFDCYYYTDQTGGHAVGTPSFQQTPDPVGINIGNEAFEVSYSPWQTVGIDLTPYTGQSVTVKISCDWCMFNYDWAYCYIDADCSSLNAPKYFSCGILPANLLGPPNMKNYYWIAPNGIDTVSRSISCNASILGVYTLYCTPNLTCEGSQLKYSYSTLPQINAGFVCDNIKGFAPLTVNFTNTSQISTSSGNTSSVWSYGNGTSQNTINYSNTTSATYTAAGTYTTMLLVSKNNCVDTAWQIIEVELPSMIKIPDVFTPNGDGTNDVFFLQTSTLKEINAQIYDRWGNEVFESKSVTGNIAWDGKNLKGNECAAGVYFYKINAMGADDKVYDQKGNICLFR